MKKVLVLSDFFFPAYKAGGPIKSLKNLCRIFGDVKFDVITSNKDIDGELIDTNTTLFENVNTYYTSNIYEILSSILKLTKMNEYDYIYLNSFFSVKFSLLIRMLIATKLVRAQKVILAPRGELTKGALSLKSFRKNVFLNIYKVLSLHKNITFQFTSKEENKDGLSILGNVDSILVSNMHDEIPNYIEKIKHKDNLEIVFLSRISEKKNLLTLCKALAFIVSEDVKIKLNIVGNIENSEYWNLCLAELSKTNDNISYRYLGSKKPDEIKSILESSHVFVLPTLNENYGHAIVEAMTYSNIVVISDQTPWSEVSNHGSIVISYDDVDELHKCLLKIAYMNNEEYTQSSYKTYNYIFSKLTECELNVRELFNV